MQFARVGERMQTTTGAGSSPFTETGIVTRTTPPIENGACWCYENALKIVEGDRRDEFHKLSAMFRRLRYLIRVYYNYRVTQARTSNLKKYCDFPTVFDMVMNLHKLGLYLQVDLPRLWALMAAGGPSFEKLLLDDELDIGPYRVIHKEMTRQLDQDELADDDNREVLQIVSDKAEKDLATYAMTWFFVNLHVVFVFAETQDHPERKRWAENALRRLIVWSTSDAWRDTLGDPLTDSIRLINWNKDALVHVSILLANTSCIKLCEDILKGLPASAWDKQTRASLVSITRALSAKTEHSDDGREVLRHPIFSNALFQMYKRHGIALFRAAGKPETWRTPVLFHFLSHSLKRATLEMQTQLVASSSSPTWKKLLDEYIYLPCSVERRYKWSNLGISDKWDCVEFHGCDNENCPEKAELMEVRDARARKERNGKRDWRLSAARARVVRVVWRRAIARHFVKKLIGSLSLVEEILKNFKEAVEVTSLPRTVCASPLDQRQITGLSPARSSSFNLDRHYELSTMAFNPPSSFASNPLQTHGQVASFLTDLLDGLEGHTSPGGARIQLGHTGTHFDETAAQLEGFSRPLWGLASLVAGGSSYDGLDRWIRGLANGADPQSHEFWGWMTDKDQRMVECSAIGYFLGVTAENGLGHVWEGLGEKGQTALGEWLGGMNDKTMPNTNWLWFRVFANLGLHKVNSPRYDADQMKADLDHLDTFYLGQGWSRDGPEGVVQLDYYSSSFAIQVAQLLYSRLAEDVDPDRSREFKERATTFALDFVHYFDEEGRAIPFGRSMCYRSAMAAFWAAFAFAFGKDSEATLPSPWTWGTIKGLLLRNLRYWARQPGAYAPALPPSPIPQNYKPRYILTLGYTYPNQSILENYNSPGSVYWACKAFICLALPDGHPFWTSKEETYPFSILSNDSSLKANLSSPSPPLHPIVLTKVLQHPLHLMVHVTVPLTTTTTTGGHTYASHAYLLSSGQQCSYAVKQSAAKYGKLSYSSAFGYSVPVGGAGSGGAFIKATQTKTTTPSTTVGGKAKGGAAGAAGTGGALEELGGDSTLAVSDDGGETWRTRRVTIGARFESSSTNGGKMTWLRSLWRPWPDIEIETWLIPPTASTTSTDADAPAAWYLRIHRIRRINPENESDEEGSRGSGRTRREILTAEGGWAIYGQGKDGRPLAPLHSGQDDDEDIGLYLSESNSDGNSGSIARASTKVGVSGIVDIPISSSTQVERTPQAVRMDANSNLIFPRAVLPALRAVHVFEEGDSVDKEEWFATGVLGLSKPNADKDNRDEEGLTGWMKEWAKWRTLGKRVPKEIVDVMQVKGK
ncbi:hypothetical protein D9758_006426 [Tetrapyrgos nigripes]|uniref:Uncharacterized protein n=1 Tax=Tetrapyrgos nigripes TaxID=182062 RepID=A0A8H5D932_9AGAR|nr:hypothetical protein D9758_006426 [Tetrapyrgos nigripes]